MAAILNSSAAFLTADKDLPDLTTQEDRVFLRQFSAKALRSLKANKVSVSEVSLVMRDLQTGQQKIPEEYRTVPNVNAYKVSVYDFEKSSHVRLTALPMLVGATAKHLVDVVVEWPKTDATPPVARSTETAVETTAKPLQNNDVNGHNGNGTGLSHGHFAVHFYVVPSTQDLDAALAVIELHAPDMLQRMADDFENRQWHMVHYRKSNFRELVEAKVAKEDRPDNWPKMLPQLDRVAYFVQNQREFIPLRNTGLTIHPQYGHYTLHTTGMDAVNYAFLASLTHLVYVTDVFAGSNNELKVLASGVSGSPWPTIGPYAAFMRQNDEAAASATEERFDRSAGAPDAKRSRVD